MKYCSSRPEVQKRYMYNFEFTLMSTSTASWSLGLSMGILSALSGGKAPVSNQAFLVPSITEIRVYIMQLH